MKKQKGHGIVNDAILKDIYETLKSLDFGTITIKVHDSKITQIEVTRRERFDDVWLLEHGGGI